MYTLDVVFLKCFSTLYLEYKKNVMAKKKSI